jgi:hypothetical protein
MPLSMEDIIIRVEIGNPIYGEPLMIRWPIDRMQAETLFPGRPPIVSRGWEAQDYRMRVEKADHFARALGLEIARRILDACNPDYVRKHVHPVPRMAPRKPES